MFPACLHYLPHPASVARSTVSVGVTSVILLEPRSMKEAWTLRALAREGKLMHGYGSGVCVQTRLHQPSSYLSAYKPSPNEISKFLPNEMARNLFVGLAQYNPATMHSLPHPVFAVRSVARSAVGVTSIILLQPRSTREGSMDNMDSCKRKRAHA
eukprot:scaffold6400_cov24-Tisochrysis_lutea.AAC.1